MNDHKQIPSTRHSPASTPIYGGVRVNKSLIESVWGQPNRVRNVCILAHVDHGKTTLTDILLASNGIISFKQAGKLRFLDSREDEQIRGITMQSSAIGLIFDSQDDSTKGRFVVNLIDSPGHVDFSSQVLTATRLCDGCLILVDVVEGVCAQTWSVLRQARRERLTSCLVLNKMDRLICELKLSTMDASLWLHRLLEQINAAHASLKHENETDETSTFPINDYEEEKDFDEGLFYSPIKGNVIFASGLDGWAFRVKNFADIYADKLNIKHQDLTNAFWGDHYLDSKSKQIIGKEEAERKGIWKNLFTQCILDPIWTVYDACVFNWDEAKILKIANTVGASLPSRELKLKDGRGTMRNLTGQWLPLPQCIFFSIIEQIPSPLEAIQNRLKKMYRDHNQSNEILEAILQNFESPKGETPYLKEPTLAFISKFFSLSFVASEARLPVPINPQDSVTVEDQSSAQPAPLSVQFSLDSNSYREKLIGMGRVIHGVLRRGQTIFVLTPSTTLKKEEKVYPFIIKELYLLMGRDLEVVESVPIGCIFGIGGLEELVMGRKFLTLCSFPTGPALAPPDGEVVPVVQVAVRPQQLCYLDATLHGLKLLCQSDPCAETFLDEESGEYILATAGELHLEQCLKDLKDRFIPKEVKVIVSEPLVPFRETLDRQMGPNRNQLVWKEIVAENNLTLIQSTGSIRVKTSDGFSFSVRASCVPPILEEFVFKHLELMRRIFNFLVDQQDPEFKQDLAMLEDVFVKLPAPFCDFNVNDILMVGPPKDPTNFLLLKPEFSGATKDGGISASYKSSIVTAFLTVVGCGPLAHEPMQGVVFIVEEIGESNPSSNNEEAPELPSTYASVTSQHISLARDAFQAAFLFWSPRLMLAMYKCSILTSIEMLGKVYSIISRRNGKIIGESCNEEIGMFKIEAHIPVIESFGLAEELRSKTSGIAIPQLCFLGYEYLPDDPYWIPITKTEIEEFGKDGRIFNRAWDYLLDLRRRKGLAVDCKIVEFAEKQRNLRK